MLCLSLPSFSGQDSPRTTKKATNRFAAANIWPQHCGLVRLRVLVCLNKQKNTWTSGPLNSLICANGSRGSSLGYAISRCWSGLHVMLRDLPDHVLGRWLVKNSACGVVPKVGTILRICVELLSGTAQSLNSKPRATTTTKTTTTRTTSTTTTTTTTTRTTRTRTRSNVSIAAELVWLVVIEECNHRNFGSYYKVCNHDLDSHVWLILSVEAATTQVQSSSPKETEDVQTQISWKV